MGNADDKHSFQIKVDKSASGRKLGLTTQLYGGGAALAISKIRPQGLIDTRNNNFPEEAVKVGDAITEVNGKRGVQGDRNVLYSAIAESDILTLTIFRFQEKPKDEQW